MVAELALPDQGLHPEEGAASSAPSPSGSRFSSVRTVIKVATTKREVDAQDGEQGPPPVPDHVLPDEVKIIPDASRKRLTDSWQTPLV